MEELGASCSRYDLCFSAPSPAQETPSVASLRVSIVVFRCSWYLADAKMYRNVLLNVQISRMGFLVFDKMADRCFSTRRASREVPRQSHAASTGVDPSLLRREDTFPTCLFAPKSLEHRQLWNVRYLSGPGWRPQQCWSLLRSWCFHHHLLSYDAWQVFKWLWVKGFYVGQTSNSAQT